VSDGTLLSRLFQWFDFVSESDISFTRSRPNDKQDEPARSMESQPYPITEAGRISIAEVLVARDYLRFGLYDVNESSKSKA